MAAFESWFRQDLKKPVAVRQLTGNLFSADNAANLIGVEILDDNAPAEISGTVIGYVIRSDGTTVLVQGTLDGNKCSVTLPSSCYAVIGRISIVIKLGTTTVLACTGYVYQASTDAIVDPGSVIPSISELLEKIDEMEQGTAAANAAAQNANEKATLANTAASKIDNMTVSASKLSEEASPTAQISEVSGHKHIAFGIPQGVTQIEFDDLSEQVINKSPAIECSASGSIASFPDGADGMPLKSLKVAIDPVQEGEGDPSPENVRPITGFTGVKVTRTGKNLFGGTLMRDGINASIPGAIIDEEEKTIRYAAQSTVAVDGFTTAAGLTGKFKENTAYTIIFTATPTGESGRLNTRVYYTDGSYTNLPDGEQDVKKTTVFTTNANKTLMSINKTNSSGRTIVYYEESGIFEGVLTADDFVPYEGESYDIEFPSEPGTVYGGTLDVVTGVLTVDRVAEDLSALTWQHRSGGAFSASLGDLSDRLSPISSYLSNTLPIGYVAGYASTPLGSIGIYKAASTTSDRTVYIRISESITTVADLQTWFAQNPTILVYPLFEPVSYTLTPQQARTILGQNKIFSDAGDVSVTYPADTKAYIDNQIASTRKLIAGIETEFKASKAYSVGDMLIIGNDLYKVSASIASGATITVGTNVTKTTVAEQLIALANA